jgi:hypothetical protein
MTLGAPALYRPLLLPHRVWIERSSGVLLLVERLDLTTVQAAHLGEEAS